MSMSNLVLDAAAIETFLTEQIESFGTDATDISLTATIADMGLDSLDIVELSQVVKKSLGIPVAPRDFLTVETLGDAVAVIIDKAGLN